MEEKFNILIACEESQAIANEYRQMGLNAFSCDIQECSGGHPEYHIQGDALELLKKDLNFQTQDGKFHHIEKWDLMIVHPPCTYLCNAGAVNLYHKDGSKNKKRFRLQKEAVNFFMRFIRADIEFIAVENPVGVMSSKYKKPHQIIHPYHFGDPYTKRTCLWLKNLPLLEHTNVVSAGEFYYYANGKKRQPRWSYEARNRGHKEASRIRSKTFPGIAKAIANQWNPKTLKKH